VTQFFVVFLSKGESLIMGLSAYILV